VFHVELKQSYFSEEQIHIFVQVFLKMNLQAIIHQ